MANYLNELNLDSDEVVLHILRKTNLFEKFIQQCIEIQKTDTFLYFLDFVEDYLKNEAPVIKEEKATGSSGDFPVLTREYMGIYFVQTPDFEDRGYFLSVDGSNFAASDITDNYTSQDN